MIQSNKTIMSNSSKQKVMNRSKTPMSSQLNKGQIADYSNKIVRANGFATQDSVATKHVTYARPVNLDSEAKIAAIAENLGAMNKRTRLSDRPDIQAIRYNIRETASRSQDPDETDDLPVSSFTARYAEQLIVASAQEAYVKSVTWFAPSISTTPNGGMQISWRLNGNSLSLTLNNETIIAIKKRPSERPARQEASWQDALTAIFSLFKNAQAT